MGVADVRAGDTIHLWPNGLRWWFLGIALSFGFFAVVFLGPKLCSLWYGFAISLVVFVWMVWLYPSLVFYGRRHEVLSDLWGTWPPQMDKLYGGVPALVTKSSERNLLKALLPYNKQGIQRLGRLLGAFLPYGRGYRSVANGESTPAALEYAAFADCFVSKPSTAEPSTANIWCDRGFLRWLTIRCGPVVAGQLFILALVAWATLGEAKEVILPILGCILLWTGLAAYFLRRAVCTFEQENRVSLEDLLHLPYLSHALESTYLLQTLPRLSVPLVVAILGINLTFVIPLLGVVVSSTPSTLSG
ncbi:MAG: hypothetical protein LGR52_08675 [Candidatus Thiosymbion ectosymbiont of Robbea hypermnestra]|nr:hypothetical protein [Candidatus Thiosymbion ectosymbiont of Robbea hypermnestra]